MEHTHPHNGKKKQFKPLQRYSFTKHAKKRMLQRDITKSDVRAALDYGKELQRTGIVFFFLGADDMPEVMQTLLDYLEGVTVLLDPDTAEVITTYRNPDGLEDIKSKPEHVIP